MLGFHFCLRCEALSNSASTSMADHPEVHLSFRSKYFYLKTSKALSVKGSYPSQIINFNNLRGELHAKN